MATEQRVDGLGHQEGQLPQQAQDHAVGSHWGAEPSRTHQTAAGPVDPAIRDSFKPTDPHLAQPTVDPRATQTPIVGDQQNPTTGVGTGPQVVSTSSDLEVLCGPLLNYKRMSGVGTDHLTWHGSILIVATPGQQSPRLRLRCLGPVSDLNAVHQAAPEAQPRWFDGIKLYEDPRKGFWRFELDLPFLPYEARWEYHIPGLQLVNGGDSHRAGTKDFCVPSSGQSMRILFHSCNGFSVGTDVDAWSGPALWHDVLRVHLQRPFHVMIGGGDQIYNDGVRVDGPLRPWTDISNPKKRRDFPFDEEMRTKCDEYYFNNYVRWYGTEPFCSANGQIPQINIWDDHDIIDGFGSYTDHFMRCAVFRGIGGVAHKYYLLFQHHLAPPKSTFTTDAPKTMHADDLNGTPADPVQLRDTFVMTETREEDCYIIGQKPGPYVEECSRSIYCQLGARIAFAGIDARLERTRHQINYPETYDLLFTRLKKELDANKNIKHLILLLGVPIAYPRLQWLENIFSSPIIGPLRLLNKRFGFAGSFFNRFDGNVDLLDDLDDHYTARHHKHERRDLIQRLQLLSKQTSVRVSILGGDVHLAAVGRFYSNPKLGIPAEHDWRYMPNIISSAITNKPPPTAVANLLASRNKVHHLDRDTDETLLEMFDRDPGMSPSGEPVGNENGQYKIKRKTGDGNHCTMPSRNYAIINESHATPEGGPPVPAPATAATNGEANGANNAATTSAPLNPKDNPRKPIHRGEENAGTSHRAAGGVDSTGLGGPYGLDVTLRVEITPSDPQGRTEGYGITVPGLDIGAYAEHGTRW